MREQPDAPYYLVQTVLIQDLSLHQAQNRIAELERQVEESSQKSRAAFSAACSAAVNPHRRRPRAAGRGAAARKWRLRRRRPRAAMAARIRKPAIPSKPRNRPMAAAAGRRHEGGGFLRSAAATAAGVAGGALLFQGISSMFGNGYANSLGASMNPGLGESVANNYYGEAAAAITAAAAMPVIAAATPVIAAAAAITAAAAMTMAAATTAVAETITAAATSAAAATITSDDRPRDRL